MSKVTDIWIHVEENGQKIDFETTVNVTKEGIFTTTLPKPAVNQLEEYGLKMEINRAGNPGYFGAKTLEELRAAVKAACREALSRECIEEKLVIKYEIKTECIYCRDSDGTPVPNGYWLKEQSDNGLTDRWVHGNGRTDGAPKVHTPSISVYARVFHKKRYRYQSGKELVELERYIPARTGNRDNWTPLDWLNSLIDVLPSRMTETGFRPNEKEYKQILERLPEVEATEKNALYFVTMYKLIFKMNELFRDFSQPEVLSAFLEKNDFKELPF